jgi:hypothetical protein
MRLHIDRINGFPPLKNFFAHIKVKTSFSVNRKGGFRSASQERFELPTDGLEGRCSIQLSYWDTMYYTLNFLLAASSSTSWFKEAGCVEATRGKFNDVSLVALSS